VRHADDFKTTQRQVQEKKDRNLREGGGGKAAVQQFWQPLSKNQASARHLQKGGAAKSAPYVTPTRKQRAVLLRGAEKNHTITREKGKIGQ